MAAFSWASVGAVSPARAGAGWSVAPQTGHGRPGFQPGRQDARLLVQKSPVEGLVASGQPVGLGGRRSVGPLRRAQGRLPAAVVRQGRLQLRQLLPPPPGRLLPVAQPLFLGRQLRQGGNGLPAGLDGRGRRLPPIPEGLRLRLRLGQLRLCICRLPAGCLPAGQALGQGVQVVPPGLRLGLRLHQGPLGAAGVRQGGPFLVPCRLVGLQRRPLLQEPVPLAFQLRFLLNPVRFLRRQLLQLAVAGQDSRQGSRLPLQLPALGQLTPRLIPARRPGRLGLALGRRLPAQPVQPLPLLGLLPGRAHLDGRVLQLPACLGQGLPEGRLPGRILPEPALRRLQLLRQEPLGQDLPLGRLEAGRVLLQAGPGRGAPLLEAHSLLLEPVLQPLIAAGVEQLPEDGLALLRLCQEQLQEVPLGNHRHLAELLPGQPQQRLDGLVHRPDLGHHPAVRANQRRLGLLDGGAAAPAGGPLILRRALDRIRPPAVGKRQLHRRLRSGVGVLGAEHRRLPVLAAGLAVEGEDDGVENRRLPRPGVAGNQVEAPLPQPRQVHLGGAGVGPEGRHGQLQRSHGVSPQISAISVSASCRCCAPMGRPLAWVKKSSSSSSGDRRSASPASSKTPAARVRRLS